ncbi:MAG: phosphoribosyl-AMP cyclohydrolase [Microgenomates group bacterium]
MSIKGVDFKKGNGFIPAVIQEGKSKEVYMVGYMNEDALAETQRTRYVCFWSRSRNTLWMKGETSGNRLKVEKIMKDCDSDALLIFVTLEGTCVCHSGSMSCFNYKL